MNATDNATLDWIEMTNGDVHRGVVDYSNSKFVHFYNFDCENTNPDLIIVAIIWRLKHHDMRFSVFCAINFPSIKLPKINIINKKGIEALSSTGVEVKDTTKVRFSADTT